MQLNYFFFVFVLIYMYNLILVCEDI